jgi:hypothetical protein
MRQNLEELSATHEEQNRRELEYTGRIEKLQMEVRELRQKEVYSHRMTG